MLAVQDTDYWLGSMAMAVAIASVDPNPQPILRHALKEFLAEQGNTELAALLRQAIKEKP